MRRRYPGHIAKAERQLREYLTRVDVVVEARDARIGATTAHPSLEEWVGARPRVIVFTFADLAPPAALSEWKSAMKGDASAPTFFVDAKKGNDKELRGVRAALNACGRAVNEKRRAKGIAPRPARVAVVGYPNAGARAGTKRLRGGSTVTFHGDESRRRRGCHVDIPWRPVAATPWLRRGYSVETSRGGAVAATWIVRGDESLRGAAAP